MPGRLLSVPSVAPSLPEKAVKTLVRAFISCCLDYCNALLYGISDSVFRRLQSIQNAAACFLTGEAISATVTTPVAALTT